MKTSWSETSSRLWKKAKAKFGLTDQPKRQSSPKGINRRSFLAMAGAVAVTPMLPKLPVPPAAAAAPVAAAATVSSIDLVLLEMGNEMWNSGSFFMPAIPAQPRTHISPHTHTKGAPRMSSRQKRALRRPVVKESPAIWCPHEFAIEPRFPVDYQGLVKGYAA